ncbi:uncharacterized protein MELLADRAFT_65214 [Melampsora larici-populina 98AG31]|uniref:Uncharacterized protein n=1 Tax=Melampsora larici-populina (strain 98AG31 / pathotype 3-4-7) TaxID=747676 RepID=F4RUE8_MELLP|nr:uncharacterized protein MELLADRAFT_65214 [Melampsora larici-populina 98AG31]EGG03922.1 hypothetical protein MELLADRAFT_65214 [Melampsora larici-populina 98AG31]
MPQFKKLPTSARGTIIPFQVPFPFPIHIQVFAKDLSLSPMTLQYVLDIQPKASLVRLEAKALHLSLELKRVALFSFAKSYVRGKSSAHERYHLYLVQETAYKHKGNNCTVPNSLPLSNCLLRKPTPVPNNPPITAGNSNKGKVSTTGSCSTSSEPGDQVAVQGTPYKRNKNNFTNLNSHPLPNLCQNLMSVANDPLLSAAHLNIDTAHIIGCYGTSSQSATQADVLADS